MSDNDSSPTDLATRVMSRFRRVPKNLHVIDSRGSSHDNRKFEFYHPDEMMNPIPGRPTVEVFDQEMSDDEIERMIAAETIHYLSRTNNVIATMKNDMKAARTTEQKATDRRAYSQARSEGDGRSFDEWMNNHRMDQYLIAIFLPDASPQRREWMDSMNQSQKKIAVDVAKYMRTGEVEK